MSAATSLPHWLGDHQLLLAFLRKRDFVIGLDREIRFLQLLVDLSERGPILATREDAARWFAPVLCSNVDDQARLPDLLKDYELERPAREITSKAPECAAPAGRGLPVSRIVAVAVACLFLIVSASWQRPISQLNAPSETPPVQSKTRPTEPERLPQLMQDLSSQSAAIATQIMWPAIPFAFAMLLIAMHRIRQIALSRGLVDDELAHRFSLSPQEPGLFRSDSIKTAARTLKAPRRLPTSKFSVRETLRATVRAGGRIHLRYSSRLQQPEYVLLLERISSADHIGALGRSIASVLSACGLQTRTYSFDQDMRLLRLDPQGTFEPLNRVASRAQGQRLIVISDGKKLLKPDGHVRDWLPSVLSQFSSIGLLSPAAPSVWGRREKTLADAGMQIYSATGEGIRSLADALTTFAVHDSPQFLQFQENVDVAEQMELDHTFWLSETPPEDKEQRAMAVTLRAWLGAAGFELLAALAAFGEIRADLTTAVAAALAPRSGILVVDEQTLAEMMRLPWLRHGRMPDWVRLTLLRALPPASSRRIRKAYAGILKTMLSSPKVGDIEIYHLPRSRRVAVWAPASKRERLIWDFIRNSVLELPAPRSLGRRLRPRLDITEWVALSASGLVALAVGFWMIPAMQALLPSTFLQLFSTKNELSSFDPQETMLGLEFGLPYNKVRPENYAYLDLPIAAEYKADEVRFLWQYIDKEPGWSTFLAGNKCMSNNSYVVWLFKDQKLFRVSVRLYNDDNCNYSPAVKLLDGIPRIAGVATNVHRDGLWTVYEFIKTGVANVDGDKFPFDVPAPLPVLSQKKVISSIAAKPAASAQSSPPEAAVGPPGFAPFEGSGAGIPNLSGDWVELNPKANTAPRRIKIEQSGSRLIITGAVGGQKQVIVAGGVATWSGPMACSQIYRSPGYNYDGPGLAGTFVSTLSRDGSLLLYNYQWNWTAPCGGHPIGTESDAVRFQNIEQGSDRLAGNGDSSKLDGSSDALGLNGSQRVVVPGKESPPPTASIQGAAEPSTQSQASLTTEEVIADVRITVPAGGYALSTNPECPLPILESTTSIAMSISEKKLGSGDPSLAELQATGTTPRSAIFPSPQGVRGGAASCGVVAIVVPDKYVSITFKFFAANSDATLSPCVQEGRASAICPIGGASWTGSEANNIAVATFKNWSGDISRVARVQVIGMLAASQ